MAKKRKAGASSAPKNDPSHVDPKDGKIGVVRTFEDVADSEDEFHINRDKILFDEGPEAKRRRKYSEEDEILSDTDEEAAAYDDASSDEDEPAPKKSDAKTGKKDVEEEDDDEVLGDFGTSRKDYYDADQIETEADALEEEAEAKRIQQKKLQKMSDADFGFDESEWANAAEDEDEGDVVTEVLKDVEISDDMSSEDRLRLLRGRYPEFDFLANEYLDLTATFKELSSNKDSRDPITEVKLRAVAAYLGALAMYFAILSSPAKSGEEKVLALNPAELRDHPVMDSLLQSRELWAKVKGLKVHTTVDSDEVSDEENIEDISESGEEDFETKVTKKQKTPQLSEAAKRREAKIRAAEADLADLSSLVPSSKSKKAKKAGKQDVPASDTSDFGEEEALDARDAAEKARRKKSLKFYTSQIVQKANRRAGAGRDAGGDTDLPYRERLKDKQARLQAEAEKRKPTHGADLGDDSGSEGGDAVPNGLDEDDEYYDMVSRAAADRKSSKAAAKEARAAEREAQKLNRVEEDGEVDADGKRAIGYTIEKNKGLTAKRKKEVRNPRLKKRLAYEAKKKKLASMRPVYKGGEGKGYGGELTGIKKGLVRSTKLS